MQPREVLKETFTYHECKLKVGASGSSLMFLSVGNTFKWPDSFPPTDDETFLEHLTDMQIKFFSDDVKTRSDEPRY